MDTIEAPMIWPLVAVGIVAMLGVVIMAFARMRIEERKFADRVITFIEKKA